MRALLLCAVLLTILMPPLVLMFWPMVSLILARSSYLARAAKLEDSFARLAAGILLALLSGLSSALLLGLAVYGSARLWSMG